MRKLIVFIFTLVCVVPVWALHVECIGTATQVVQGKDTVLLFAGEPHLHSKVGNVDWYTSGNVIIQTNSDDCYPQSGEVIVKQGGKVLDIFYVFDYSQYIPNITAVEVTPRCRETLVQLKGDIPALNLGGGKTLLRKCTISYTDLTWEDDGWKDFVVSHTGNASHKMHLPAFYQTTSFSISFDKEWQEALQMTSKPLVSAEIAPIAVKAHITSTTTVRGIANEKSNEVDRPTDATILSGSAPMEMLFESHPTPAVTFYDWRIYRGSDLLVTRADETVRYSFETPGQYRVIGRVMSPKCPCQEADSDCERDSTEIKISIPESLLKVPNVFTPNGDGMNDEFRVQYRSLREFHIWVYNRWGHLVYESTDPSKGWDGTIGARPAAEGAYYYVIRALGTDADKNADYHSRQAYEKGKKNADNAYMGIYQLSGDINLLRGKQK